MTRTNFEFSMLVFTDELNIILKNERNASSFETVKKMIVNHRPEEDTPKFSRVEFSLPWSSEYQIQNAIRELFSAALFAGWLQGREEIIETYRSTNKNK